MKRLISVLAVAAMACGALSASAFAPKEKPFVPTPDSVKKGMAEAPAGLTQAGVTCELTNAYYIGDNTKKVDKKDVKTHLYEAACKNSFGYLLVKGDDGVSTAFNCIMMQAGYDTAKDKEKAARCKLAENQDLNGQIQGAVNKTSASCTVTSAKWLGTSDTAKLNRYEIACSQGGGYLFDVPFDGSVKQPTSCLAAEAAGIECVLTPKAARTAQIAAIGTSVDKSCQVSNGRWVGIAADGKEYFEIACTGKPGFFVENNKGAMRAIDCVHATTIGGGCKLTDVAVARAGAAQSYAGILKDNGIVCTAQDLKIIGKETKAGRDVIEFKCPEQAYGLVAMIPGAGSTAKFESMDCLTAAVRALKCTLNDKAAILTKLQGILTAVDKVCTPSDYKVLGPGDTDGELVEIKCGAGESGYVVDLPANRAKTIKTMTCVQAARGYNKCEIPGNA